MTNLQNKEYGINLLPVFSPYKTIMINYLPTITGNINNPPKVINALALPMEKIINYIYRLDISNEKEILEFCDEYGLPGSPSSHTLSEYYGKNIPVDVCRMVDECRKIYKSFPDWERKLGKNRTHLVDPLQEAVFSQPLFSIKNCIEDVKTAMEGIKELEVIDSQAKEDKKELMIGISCTIDRLINDVEWGMGIREHNGNTIFANWYNYTNLSQVFGIYLYEKASGNKLKICKKCEDFFPPERKNQEFCSKSCKNAYNQQTHRNKIRKDRKTDNP